MTNSPDRESVTGRAPAWTIAALLTIAALFYAAAWRRTFVGFYYDDADYVLTAMAFIRGHLTSLRLPGTPVLHSHWPGFSLILALLIPLVAPHWEWLKIVPLLCVLGCAALVFRWCGDRFSRALTLAATALFALNPLTVERAGALLSEPLFLLLFLAVVCGLGRENTAIKKWPIALLLAGAALVRPEGILLAAAVVLALYLWGDGRTALAVSGPVLLLAASYGALCAAGRLRFPAYWTDWLSNAPAMNALALFRQATAQLLTFFAGVIFNLPQPQNHFLWGTGILLTLGALILVVRGFTIAWRDEARRIQTAALGFFSVGYFAAHVFWPIVDRRFLWVLLPIGIYFFLAGADFWRSASGSRQRAGAVLLLALLIAYGWTNLRALRPSPSEAAATRFPRASLAWISAHAAANERLLTNNPAMLYLYTGRSALGLPPQGLYNAASFYYICQVKQVSALCYLPSAAPFANLPTTDTLIAQWRASQSWAESRTYAFEKLFEAPDEAVAVYRVRPAPHYLQAYRLYVSAMADFANQKPVWGAAKIAEVLREDPQFPEALVVYGGALLAQGGSPTEAATYFATAQRLDPTTPTVAPSPPIPPSVTRRRN